MPDRILILGNGMDWCEKSISVLCENKNISLLNNKVPVNGKWKNQIARIYFSWRINKLFSMPFKSIWYKQLGLYLKRLGFDKGGCILIYDHNVFGGEETFIGYIRKNIP